MNTTFLLVALGAMVVNFVMLYLDEQISRTPFQIVYVYLLKLWFVRMVYVASALTTGVAWFLLYANHVYFRGC